MLIQKKKILKQILKGLKNLFELFDFFVVSLRNLIPFRTSLFDRKKTKLEKVFFFRNKKKGKKKKQVLSNLTQNCSFKSIATRKRFRTVFFFFLFLHIIMNVIMNNIFNSKFIFLYFFYL